MGILEDMHAKVALERPHFILSNRNVAIAYEQYLRGRIPLLLLTEVVDLYGNDMDSLKLREAAEWIGRQRQ